MDSEEKKGNSVKIKFECKCCDKSFATKYTLQRHIREIHAPIAPIDPEKTDLKLCLMYSCGEKFPDTKSLYSHMREIHDEVIHEEDEEDMTAVLCGDCGNIYSNESTLRKHIQTVHETSSKTVCPLCDTVCKTVLELDNHLMRSHDVQQETETKVFSSDQDFMIWKNAIEAEGCASFPKRRSKGNKTYYSCHRSGIRHSQATKRIQWKGSCRTGRSCPARMTATSTDEGITVKFHKTHVGHIMSIRHLTLTTEERNLLAEKINAGVTFDRMYSVRVNLSNDCSGCPLTCPLCRVCVHQYTCTCIDHQIKGNVCKHVHACIRQLMQNTATCVSKEEDVTAAFEKHNSALIRASQEQPVHVAEAVSNSTRLKSLLHTALGYVCNLPDESLPEACKKTEALVQFFQKIKLENSEASDTFVSHFPELPKLPPHRKVKHQRFFSTKKKSAPSERRLSKPTDMQKKSIKAVMNATTSEVVYIHSDFDHMYNQTKDKKKKTDE